MSAGCLNLIKNREATLITDAASLVADMRWGKPQHAPTANQQTLFSNLLPDETTIVDTLRSHSPIHIDTLARQLPALAPQLPALLLNLEIQNIVAALPGKHYKLVDD
jgi:DNA processing protein